MRGAPFFVPALKRHAGMLAAQADLRSLYNLCCSAVWGLEGRTKASIESRPATVGLPIASYWVGRAYVVLIQERERCANF
jgi:hypothetical protein